VITPAATEFARRNPKIAAAIGASINELATLASTTATLAQAEQLGWISTEERRLYEGDATLEDLRALGYGEEDAIMILDDQK
jgi:hypothetical protein